MIEYMLHFHRTKLSTEKPPPILGKVASGSFTAVTLLHNEEFASQKSQTTLRIANSSKNDSIGNCPFEKTRELPEFSLATP